MNPEQIQLIRRSFARVASRADVAGLVFYQKLFSLDPSLRPMFTTNIHEQSDKLMRMLGAAVELLDQPQALVPVLETLGRRHAGYGVKDQHYETVRVALLEMLEECLNSEFTPEIRAAWSTLYEFISATMRAGTLQAAMVNS